jgi:hypothetical protein
MERTEVWVKVQEFVDQASFDDARLTAETKRKNRYETDKGIL